ncbi:MAG: hypothetical protein ABI972_06645 [Acidobacteriota bacterium]
MLNNVPDDPPPFLGSWRRIYIVVVVYLCAFIGLLALFTRSFRP